MLAYENVAAFLRTRTARTTLRGAVPGFDICTRPSRVVRLQLLWTHARRCVQEQANFRGVGRGAPMKSGHGCDDVNIFVTTVALCTACIQPDFINLLVRLSQLH
jgi:hypothetical protein